MKIDNATLGIIITITLYLIGSYIHDTNFIIMANVGIIATIIETIRIYGPRYKYKEETNGVETI
jgi:hypothetical protein